MRRSAARSAALLLAAAAAAGAQAQGVGAEPCTAAVAQAAVDGFSGEMATRIRAASWFAGGATEDGKPASPANPVLPAHCRVTGVIGAHRGPPGDTAYGNQFRLRIPAAWNGRFVFQGGGGNNGVVGNALGLLKSGALALDQGYAVAAQDSGHVGGAPSFALDRQAYDDFAHAGVHKATLVSKAVIAAVAGEKPRRAYFVGCSNGGREAMVSAQRHDDFDGVVAGAPGFAVYDQWLQNLQMLRIVSEVAGTPPGTLPTDTSGAYSDAQLDHAARHFLRKCDALDGLADGIIANHPACRAEPEDEAALTCEQDGGQSRDANCLSRVQMQGLRRMYAGANDSRGRLLFPGFYPGGIETVLRGPYLGSAGSTPPLGAFYATIMANFAFMGYGFRGYPGLRGPADELASYPSSSVAYVAGFDFDTEPARLEPGRLDFQAGNVDPRRPGPNYEAFRRRGGKLLIYTGTHDPGVQPAGVVDFIERLNRQLTPAVAGEMAALFLVPGMQHCRGGAATEVFDNLAPLVAWVEQGQRPERIVAGAMPGSALDRQTPGITRPLCRWPAHAHYDGTGPVADAASFRCRTP